MCAPNCFDPANYTPGTLHTPPNLTRSVQPTAAFTGCSSSHELSSTGPRQCHCLKAPSQETMHGWGGRSETVCTLQPRLKAPAAWTHVTSPCMHSPHSLAAWQLTQCASRCHRTACTCGASPRAACAYECRASAAHATLSVASLEAEPCTVAYPSPASRPRRPAMCHTIGSKPEARHSPALQPSNAVPLHTACNTVGPCSPCLGGACTLCTP